MTRIVVLLSGGGTTFQALLDAISSGQIKNCDIVDVVSDKAQAQGLERAAKANCPTSILSARDYPSREAYDEALAEHIAQKAPDYIVLAGFMRILGASFVQRFQNKIFNIHPSLLPKFRGLHTHQRALEAGETEHGTSIHVVTEELDGGPILAQAKLGIQAGDTADTLEARVKALEWQLYPWVLARLCSGELTYDGGEWYYQGTPIATGGIQLDEDALALA